VVIIRHVILEYLAPRFELADLGWTEYRFPVVVMEEVVELGIPVALQLFLQYPCQCHQSFQGSTRDQQVQPPVELEPTAEF
jgi:hypothetical protein